MRSVSATASQFRRCSRCVIFTEIISRKHCFRESNTVLVAPTELHCAHGLGEWVENCVADFWTRTAFLILATVESQAEGGSLSGGILSELKKTFR